MGHREARRVPLDFDAPLGKVWAPLLMPDDIRPPTCGACDGSGYSPMASWLQATWYDHNVRQGVGGWKHLLTQEDIDWLVEDGHLRVLRPREPTEDNPRDWEWVSEPRRLEDVMAKAGDLDSMPMYSLVRRRCEQLGHPHKCPVCDGEGYLGTPEQRAAYENWTPPPIPEGPGWQLWSTTTEGTPLSPVFDTPEKLAEWAETGATVFGSIRATRAEWLRSFLAGTTGVDSLMIGNAEGVGTPMTGMVR